MPVIEEVEAGVINTKGEKIPMADPHSLREEGNKLFKSGDVIAALTCYTQALECDDVKDSDKAVIFKNMAACHLKQEDYTQAVRDATSSLDLIPNDPKALYRRCQAYEKLGQAEEAYKDAGALIKADPRNTAVQPILRRLNPIIQQKVTEQNSTSVKVKQMFELSFDEDADQEKRLQAINNMIVLAREEAGAKCIVELCGVEKLKNLLDSKNSSIVQGSLRILSCLCKDNRPRCQLVVDKIGIKRLGMLMWIDNESLVTSVAHLIELLLIHITELDIRRKKVEEYHATRKRGDPCRWPMLELDDHQKAFVNDVMQMLVKMIQNHKVSGHGRDAAIELINKNGNREDGLQWTNHFLETDGVEGLLTVAGAIKQHETLPITENSKMHASVALSRIYNDLRNDKENKIFREKCSNFFKDLFEDDIFESKIEALKAISTLLQGPYEVGKMILEFEGVTKLMLALADSGVALHQQVALEGIVYAAQKKEKCSALLTEAVPILKKLYAESEDRIKVRALVGLCKLASAGGTDPSLRLLAEGSTRALAKSCRQFLNNPSKDVDLRRWATEGLAFLTLDAEVKEDLANDTEAIKSIIDVTAKAEKNILYPAVTVFVNLTNSYEKPDIMPEMLELAKFAKQHVPEEHEMDKPEYVKSRTMKLANAGIGAALVTLCNSDSKNTREQISRIYLALTAEEELRGLVVSQGGAKVLIKLALETNTDKGQVLAAQALAKIAITMNPDTTFPGQRMYEVVRPLIHLLHMDNTALQNFEALLALTNLSSVSDSLRKKIVAEKGLPRLEHYMFEEHELLKRAATECMCNMVMNEEVQKMYEGDNDKLKLMFLYCGDEDDPLIVRAAAGAIAMLSHSDKICKKMQQVVKPWYDLLLSLCVSESPEIQHRGCFIVQNMILSDKEVAAKVVEGQLLEVLMAISIQEKAENEQARKCAITALEQAKEYGLIQAKPSDES